MLNFDPANGALCDVILGRQCPNAIASHRTLRGARDRTAPQIGRRETDSSHRSEARVCAPI